MAGGSNLLGLPTELKGAILEYVSGCTIEHQVISKKANKYLAHLL
jgi:hypothetical protein